MLQITEKARTRSCLWESRKNLSKCKTSAIVKQKPTKGNRKYHIWLSIEDPEDNKILNKN